MKKKCQRLSAKSRITTTKRKNNKIQSVIYSQNENNTNEKRRIDMRSKFGMLGQCIKNNGTSERHSDTISIVFMSTHIFHVTEEEKKIEEEMRKGDGDPVKW